MSATFVSFDRADNGEPVYDVSILNTRTIYQFNKYFFLRGILQFDSQRKRVLTDFLASYELRPGTVLFAGYGSLLEHRAYVDGRWVPLEGDYLTTQRGLFFKASFCTGSDAGLTGRFLTPWPPFGNWSIDQLSNELVLIP